MCTPSWTVVDLPHFRTDSKPGLLAVAEPRKVTGGLFDAAARVYYIVNDSDCSEVRGGHLHPEGGKLEFLVCLRGEARVELHAPGQCGEVSLATPTRAVVIPHGIWHRVRLSPGAVLLSVASTEFAPDECIEALPCSCPIA